MLKAWTKKILFLVGIILIVLMAKNIKKPFWDSQNYVETIINFQKNQDIFPYKIRTIWWNKSIIIFSIIERSIDVIWSDNYFYLPLIFFLILIKKRKWLVLGFVIIGISIISIESDPNPGKYLLWLSPLFVSGII